MIVIPFLLEARSTLNHVVIMYRSLFETATVTVTSENASFPKYRLYDREIGKLFKGDSTPANFYITADQGGSIYEVDRVIIPSGHNLSGLLVKLQYSTDNFAADVHDALSWTQDGSGAIDKSFDALTKRYWRLNIAAPASAPELAEIYLTKEYEFERNPNLGDMAGDQKNVLDEETQSGLYQGIKHGEPRKYRHYTLTKLSATQKADLITWDRHIEGNKSFYLEDVDDEVFLSRLLTKKLLFSREPAGRFGCEIELLESLGATT